MSAAPARCALLAGNDLPQRWRGCSRFVVLDTAFGDGTEFLATWQAWRDDPQRCDRLVFIATEPRPLSGDALRAAHPEAAPADLVDQLLRAWPPLTPNLHRLSFEAGRVELLLALGNIETSLRALVAEVDAFGIDGGPVGDGQRISKAIGRLAARDATLVASDASDALRAHLMTAGFETRLASAEHGGPAVMLARFAPAFTPRRAPSRRQARDAVEPHALIIGGGLAGCAAAWALAEQGLRSTVLERHADLAYEASGNPAGLFHGIVNAQDGVHARFNRAAALSARSAVQFAIDRGVPGGTDGLVRLETRLDAARMQMLLQRLALPSDYVQALDAAKMSERAGVALAHPGWFYPGGGWVQPAGLARCFLERAGAQSQLRVGVDVQALQRIGSGWRVLDAHGRVIGETQTLVLANAGDALRLLGAPAWPIDSVRGQISLARAPRFALPRIPIAGSGYLLPDVDGRAMFGATAQPGDADPAVRDADHTANLAQLEALLGRRVDLAAHELEGRTGWRCSAADRLPVIGAVPDPAGVGTALDQPRRVPHLPGLYVLIGLGSRGITWSALGAQVLASCITGAPVPLEASLLDAIDPARFVSRQARRASRG